MTTGQRLALEQKIDRLADEADALKELLRGQLTAGQRVKLTAELEEVSQKLTETWNEYHTAP